MKINSFVNRQPNLDYQLRTIKYFVDIGKYDQMPHLLYYLNKTELSKRVDIKYARLLTIVKKPWPMTGGELKAISKVLGVGQTNLRKCIEFNTR